MLSSYALLQSGLSAHHLSALSALKEGATVPRTRLLLDCSYRSSQNKHGIRAATQLAEAGWPTSLLRQNSRRKDQQRHKAFHHSPKVLTLNGKYWKISLSTEFVKKAVCLGVSLKKRAEASGSYKVPCCEAAPIVKTQPALTACMPMSACPTQSILSNHPPAA